MAKTIKNTPETQIQIANDAATVADAVSAPAPVKLTVRQMIVTALATGLPTFGDLRESAVALGLSAKRDDKGDVKSVDGCERAAFVLLLNRYAAGSETLTAAKLLELASLSRAERIGDAGEVLKSSATGGAALFFREGSVKGESASLGSLKIRPARAAGKVSVE